MDNALQSQHLKGAGTYEGRGGGRSAKKYKDRGAGLDGAKKGGTAGGATRSHIEDRGAGLHGTVKDGTAGGTTSSNPED